MIPRCIHLFCRQMSADSRCMKLMFDPLDLVSSVVRCRYISPSAASQLSIFPIGGLSSWSPGQDGEDSRLIYPPPPPPPLGSRTRTRWPIWNDLPLSDKPACASMLVHLSDAAVEIMSDVAACWCRGHWRTSSGPHHMSDVCQAPLKNPDSSTENVWKMM